MQTSLRRVAFVLLLTPLPAFAASATDEVPDAASITQMEQKAQKADPRERSYLYTELVHVYTMIAGRQIAAGDMEHASVTLKKVEGLTERVHDGLSHNSKRLKNAEMLMQETRHHMGEYLHSVSSDDKAALEATLKHVDKVNEELLAEVFAH